MQLMMNVGEEDEEEQTEDGLDFYKIITKELSIYATHIWIAAPHITN